MYWVLLCVLWLYDAIQLIASVPLTIMADNPAMATLLRALHPIVLLPGITLFGIGGTITADVLFAIFAAVVAVGLLLMLWGVWDEYRATGYAPQWRLKLLRALWRVALLGFMVPITGSLFGPLSCSSTPGALWMDTSVLCWQSTHLGYVAGAIILLLLFIPTAVFMLATFISRTSNYSGKRNVYSAPCGRIEAASGLLKVFAAAWFVFGNAFASTHMHPILYTAGAG